jgi:uncharacterized OB-fold protein
VEWVSVSGSGHIYTWTVIHRTMLEAYRNAVPYVVAVVALDDCPVRMIGLVEGVEPRSLRIGRPVAMHLVTTADGTFPVWR